MARYWITKVEAFEGPAVHYVGDDGYPAAHIVPCVVATSVEGKIFQLPNSFQVDHDDEGFQRVGCRFYLVKAREIEAAVLKRRWIETAYWAETTEVDLKEYLCGHYWSGGPMVDGYYDRDHEEEAARFPT